MNEARMRKSLKNRAVIPRSKKAKTLSNMEESLDKLGYDTTAIAARSRSQSRGRLANRSRTGTTTEPADGEEDDAMEIDTPANSNRTIASKADQSRVRTQSNRRTDGLTAGKNGVTTATAVSKAERLQKLGQQRMNRMARQGEAYRHSSAAKIKHLVSCCLLLLIFSLL